MKFDFDNTIAVWFSPGCSVALIGFTKLSFGEEGRRRSGLASDKDIRTGESSGLTECCDTTIAAYSVNKPTINVRKCELIDKQHS